MDQRSEETFARLLTEAVYTIRLHEGKTLQIIQDELGYALGRQGGSTIDYWRRGHLPARLDDLQKLTKVLVEKEFIDDRWAAKFLIAGGYPADGLPSFINKDRTAQPHRVQNNLPRKMFKRLVGRDLFVEKILNALNEPNGTWIVGIDGLGGIGKTALAYEVAAICQEKTLFEQVIWLSAAISHADLGASATSRLSIENMLDEIASQLNLPTLIQLPLEEKTKRLKRLIRAAPYLVILDNLETAEDSQEKIIHYFSEFLAPSKMLLTSRDRFSGELLAVHLQGLDAAESETFIRQNARDKGIELLEQAEPVALKPIITMAGGLPLAIQLVTSQMAYLPIEIVLSNLKEVKDLAYAQGGGEYVRFYKHVYWRSWELMVDPARFTLLAMSQFEPQNGCHFSALQRVSALLVGELGAGLDQLWRLSLIEIGESATNNQLRYLLHPLTQNFVLSDIVRVKRDGEGK